MNTFDIVRPHTTTSDPLLDCIVMGLMWWYTVVCDAMWVQRYTIRYVNLFYCIVSYDTIEEFNVDSKAEYTA